MERELDSVEARHPGLRVVRLRPGFVFQRRAAAEQRRLFAGPLAPTALLRPGLLPVFPYPRGPAFQGLHAADDAAAAFSPAATREPVVDGAVLGAVLGATPLPVPPPLVRAVLAGAWWAHVVPAEPALFDLAMGLALMRVERARAELGWSSRVSAGDAVAEALAGMRDGAGAPTAPLSPDTVARRLRELVTGAGRRG